MYKHERKYVTNDRHSGEDKTGLSGVESGRVSLDGSEMSLWRK